MRLIKYNYLSTRSTPAEAATSKELKLSYKIVFLLTSSEPTEGLQTFLGKRSILIARTMFDVFSEKSAGCFYHAFRILESMLRLFPADVYDAICGDGRATERVGSMLRYLGHVPVCEIIIMLVSMAPITKTSPLYNSASKSRWAFFEILSQWIFILKVSEIVVKPQDHCCIDALATAEQHSSAAAHVIQELIEKLSIEDSGEILLQPFGFVSSLLYNFIDAAIDKSLQDDIRRSAIKLLCLLVRRAAEPEIACISPALGAPPTQTFISNKLFPLRDKITDHIKKRISDIMQCIMGLNDEEGNDSKPIKYSSYTIKQPFSVLRSLLIELLVLLVESDDSVAAFIPIELWQNLMSWCITYAHNNIYHAIFYRLVFAVLRHNQEKPQRLLFEKAMFIDFLIDNFIPYPDKEEEARAKDVAIDTLNKHAARGLLMNCANAMRLQASTLPSSTFIKQFLSSQNRWLEFKPVLIEATVLQQNFGMGIKIFDMKSSSLGQMVFMGYEPTIDESGIDHGSRFAKSLGFIDDTDWSDDDMNSDKVETENDVSKD